MSFPRYERYRDSGVEWLGEVPEGWAVKRLGYFFNERREKVSDRDFAPLSVTKNGVVPQLETAAKTDDGDNRKKVCAGDFVINSRSDRKGSAGMSLLDGSVSLINTVLQPYSEIDIEFTHHLLRSVPFQEEFYRYGKGIVADLWSTNYSEMRNILLAVPPLPEQQAIATFIDRETGKIDKLVAEQELLIALLKEKRQAVISHAVTKGLDPDAAMKDSGIEWLGEVLSGWEAKRFSRLIKRTEQGWSPSASSEPCEIGDWGVLKLSAVKNGRFLPNENKKLEECEPDTSIEVNVGDLLVTRGNTPELVGDACVVTNTGGYRLMLSDLIYRIHLHSCCNPNYYSYLLISKYGRSQIEPDARGSSMTMAKISQGHIRSWIMPVPPYNAQSAIVAFLDAETTRIDTLVVEAERTISLLKERRSALISAAVTGKIDVRSV